MKATDRAWAAGFFDGEGSFCILKQKEWPQSPQYRHKEYRYPRATVSQKDIRALTKFHRIVQVGKIYGPYFPKSKIGTCPYAFIAGGHKDFKKILRILWPYLGIVKKKQAFKVLKSCT